MHTVAFGGVVYVVDVFELYVFIPLAASIDTRATGVRCGLILTTTIYTAFHPVSSLIIIIQGVHFMPKCTAWVVRINDDRTGTCA